jgi:hypothetical protein
MNFPAARAALKPSLAGIVFLAVAGWLLAWTVAAGAPGLLADAGTGVHIRTGEAILERGQPPRVDPYSFTRPGHEWFAWEWLAGVAMALVNRAAGLGGVSVAFAALWALNLVLMLRRSLAHGANAMVAVSLLPLAMGAASVHFLARPHAFTVLFLLLAWKWVDDPRRVWRLVPLAAVWANTHGGFVALFALLAAEAAGAWIERDPAHARRMLKVLAACAGATFLNPYGWRLHVHLSGYLQASWLRELVEEFRAPHPGMASWPYYVVLLWSGILLAGWLAYRRRWRAALFVALWAYAAMTSVRHLSVYAFVLIPPLGGEISRWRGLPRVVEDLGRDHLAGLKRTCVWPAAVLLAACVWAAANPRWFAFPEAKYPLAAAGRHAALLDGARVFSTDAWSDYLVWRFEGRTKVAVDGRSDFYGERLCRLYLDAIHGRPGWDQTLARWRPDFILLPEASPLNGLLARDRAWAPVAADAGAALYRRR